MPTTPSTNEGIFDAELRHQIGLRRYSNGEVRRILKILDRGDRDLVSRLRGRLEGLAGATPAADATHSRLEALLANVRAARAEALAVLDGSLRKSLEDLAFLEVAVAADIVEAHVPVELHLARPTAEGLRALVYSRPMQGQPLKEWASKLVAGDRARLEQAIRLGVLEGDTVDQIVGRVRGTRANNYQDGVLTATRRDAESLVRTAVNHVSNAAREQMWLANEDLVSGLRWTATLDGRTSTVCAGRDGKVFPLKSGPRPPAHFNCRSIMVVVLDGVAVVGNRPTVVDTRNRRQREIDFRAEAKAEAGDRWSGMDAKARNEAAKAYRKDWAERVVGRAPADTTYQDFLGRQSQTFQEDVLGVTKAKLFRDGGLTLDRFVDRRGKELNLKQLRQRHAEAFQKAKID